MAVTLQIHSTTFKKHGLLSKIKNKRLLSFIASRFRATHVLEGVYLWQRGDVMEDFLFIITGNAAFVKPKYMQSIFGAASGDRKGFYPICPEFSVSAVGLEDSVVNHL
jgi:hypothetical protein